MAFIDLHVLLPRAAQRDRQEEYCVSLRRNAEHELIRSITIIADPHEVEDVATLSALNRSCPLHDGTLAKLSMSTSSDLTFAALFRSASARAAPDALQVVLNSDIVLGDWSSAGDLRPCLARVHKHRLAFGLSRREPKDCFPLLDGLARDQRRFRASDWNTYYDICSSDYLTQRSRDAMAFGAPLDEKTLRALDFHPNRLGSENLLSCRLVRAGYGLSNPCLDLPIYHNHCSDLRNYSKFRIDNLDPKCSTHRVPRQRLAAICGDDFAHLDHGGHESGLMQGKNATVAVGANDNGFRLPGANRIAFKRF